MAQRTLLEQEAWSYVIHLDLHNGRVMEIEGSKRATHFEIEQMAERLAKEYKGTVHRLYMRAADSLSGKQRVANVPKEGQPLALPAPTKVVSVAAPLAPANMYKARAMTFPQTKELMIRTTKGGRSND